MSPASHPPRMGLHPEVRCSQPGLGELRAGSRPLLPSALGRLLGFRGCLPEDALQHPVLRGPFPHHLPSRAWLP